MNPEDHKTGGEFLSPDLSPEARKVVLQCRVLMYDDRSHDALEKVLKHPGSLADGIVNFVVPLVLKTEQSSGIALDDAEEAMVILHVAGSLIDLAKGRDDPEAKEKDIAKRIMAMAVDKLDAAEAQSEQPQPEAPQDPNAQPQQQPPQPLPGLLGGGLQ